MLYDISMHKSVLSTILSRLVGFIFFLVGLGIANMLIPYLQNTLYSDVIAFFNVNILLFLIMMFLGLLTDIFWSFYFPFNIVAPIVSAVLSIYILTFIERLWNLITSYTHTAVVIPVEAIKLLVFLIVLFAGYVIILTRIGKPKEIPDKEWYTERWKARLEKTKPEKRQRQRIMWHEVGDEFRLLCYNLARSLNNLFEKKKSNPRQKESTSKPNKK